MINISRIFFDRKVNVKYFTTVGKLFNIGWCITGGDGETQTSYRVAVLLGDNTLYDSGEIFSNKQEHTVNADNLPEDKPLTAVVTVRTSGNETAKREYVFYVAGTYDSPWICAGKDIKNAPVIFSRTFRLEKKVQSAAVYVCGIGYYKLEVNGINQNSGYAPAQSDYSKTCYYNVYNTDCIKRGNNTVNITVADGWRRISSGFVEKNLGGRKITFDGVPVLSAQIRIYYTDGTLDIIDTDETWNFCYGGITYANIFNGTTYDARKTRTRKAPAKLYDGIIGKRKLQLLQPIRKYCYEPVAVNHLPGGYMFDFGQNIAGIAILTLPEGLKRGDVVTMLYGEMLNEDGTIYTAPLREAECTDRYICGGMNDVFFIPEFTFHGFRYVFVTGLPYADKNTLMATALYTDLKNKGSFECGSPLVNKIHENAYMTELDNMHSVLSDCPQRDERMGWLNDATVRFEETPYNFDIGQMFPKIVDDILDAQLDNGMIGCTAPFIFGQLPADPVCSSFLVAADKAYMFTGNTDVLARGFDRFAAWENVLLERSDDYIVNYSYYGDWAAPSYACITEEFACSAVTPGILMSTGYSYYNCRLLEKFASVLKMADKEKFYRETAEKIARAFCNKWLDAESGRLECGSMGAYAFALWLGILPKDCRGKAAKHMRDDLIARDYKFTTGNLTTRYLYDMLAEYGYLNEAWTLLTRTEYPSIGFEINNGATTVWERFELKKDPGMNSHNHPMYGSVDYFIHAYLAGIKITAPACERISVKPYLPDGLLYCRETLCTVKGDIEVKWVVQYGKKILYLTVPFGVVADVDFCGEKATVNSGFHVFTV